MKIQISKDDFEQSILAATSSHSEVFESVEPHFKESYLRLSQQILGEVGEAALETSDDLREAVIGVPRCLPRRSQTPRPRAYAYRLWRCGQQRGHSSQFLQSRGTHRAMPHSPHRGSRHSHVSSHRSVRMGKHPPGSAGHTDGCVEHGGLLLSHETDQHDLQGLDVQAGSHAGGRRHPAQAGVRRADG